MSGGRGVKSAPAIKRPLTNLRAAFSLALLALTGCYTYAESSLASLSPGLQARVTLTEDGFGRVVNQVASSGVPVDMLDVTRRGFVGRVTAMGPSSLTVELRGGGGSVFAANVPTQSVEQVAVRTFSRKRTILAGAGLAVLFAAVYTGTTGGTTQPGLPNDPDQLVVPTAHGLQIGGRLQVENVMDVLARLTSSR
jgi:hypothetical protein